MAHGDSLRQHMALKIEDAGRKIAGLRHDGAEGCAQQSLRLLLDNGGRRFHMIWRRMAETPLGVSVRLAAFISISGRSAQPYATANRKDHLPGSTNLEANRTAP
jgi:hypothetical protein